MKKVKCKLWTEEAHSRHEIDSLSERQRTKCKHFKCNLCGSEASTECNLIRHIRTHTCERPFKCTVDDCGMAFKQEYDLNRHITVKHNDKRPFTCDFPGCAFTAKISGDLTKHLIVHSVDKSFACSECDYKTNWKKALKEHKIRRHSIGGGFKCSHPECTKSYTSSLALKRHFSNRHGERNVPCDHPGCEQKFANAHGLKSHKRNVHSTKSLVCPTLNCSYRTNKPCDLTRHMNVHDGRDEKIPCSLEGCQYKGKHRRALASHMRRHKSHLACPVSGCGGYAATKKALDEHVKLHRSSGRPYQCPLCFKHFRKLTHLQDHCFAHTNEKPFACGHCEFAASFRSSVKKHISSAHAHIKFPFILHLLDDRECLD